MTIRAVAAGLLIGVFLAAFGYVGDWVLKLPYVAYDLMPVSVFGLLVLGIILVNPLLSGLRRRPVRGAEWATICCLAMVACVIPGPALLSQFHNVLATPVFEAKSRPGWQQHGDRPALMDCVPAPMLVDEHQGQDVLSGFRYGLGKAKGMQPISRVPWRAWAGPYGFYLPLVVMGFVASICLMLILHPQWAHREHLRYPIAEVAGMLIGQAGGAGSVVRHRAFWIGFAISAGVLAVNGLKAYFPGFIEIPMRVDLTPLSEQWPAMREVPHRWTLIRPTVYFSVLGLAFLVSSEVAFSVGISHVAFAVVFAALTATGVDVSNNYMSGGVPSFQLFGSFLGGGLFILYVGRKFYWSVLQQAAGIDRGDPVEGHVVWACRTLILVTLASIVLLRVAVGLDLLTATLVVMLFGLAFLIVARINLETGLLFVQPTWQGVAILLGAFGIVAMGPRTLIIVALLGTALTIDPRVCLMPLVGNGLKLAEGQRVRPGRIGAWMLVVLLLGLVVAVPLTLYVQYNVGGSLLYPWADKAAMLPFNMLERSVDQLAARGELETAGAATGVGGLARLARMKPDPRFLWAAAAGVVLVFACGAARLRWTWWPIHPVMFMVWGTMVSAMFGASFLAGWLIKALVIRFGSRGAYARARVFFVGLIAGGMVAGVGWMIVGTAYYASTGAVPPAIKTHP